MFENKTKYCFKLKQLLYFSSEQLMVVLYFFLFLGIKS